MPTGYVKKLARKHGTSTKHAEGKWAKAKAAAASQGHEGNYAYVTSIFQNMMHETPHIASLKDLTRGMSFKYFLVAEDDTSNAPVRERSPAWKHLEKFAQFNELPFKIRRELEKEVESEGLIDGYEALEPEEKESVDDHLRELVIDKMSAHFGQGINVGDWKSAEATEPTDDELAGEEPTDAEVAPEDPLPRRRRERAPSHIAAMRGPHTTDLEPTAPEAGGLPTTGTRKSYYKPWAELSDEQRRGRAALAKKHGMMYRIKNAKWFRTMAPEKQQTLIDLIKSGKSVEEARAAALAA